MNVTIKALGDCAELAKSYAEQLANWHHNEWLHLNPGATLSTRLQRYNQSIKSNELPKIFVATVENELLGSVTLDKEDMDTRAYLTPWLASLFVKPENRKQGVASLLIEYVIQYAKQHDYKNIYLFTEDQTDYYQRRGWHFVESVEYRGAEVDLMCQRI